MIFCARVPTGETLAPEVTAGREPGLCAGEMLG